MNIELDDCEIAMLRVALASFSEYLAEDGLGDDQHGREMVRLYQININSVLKKILNKQVA